MSSSDSDSDYEYQRDYVPSDPEESQFYQKQVLQYYKVLRAAGVSSEEATERAAEQVRRPKPGRRAHDGGVQQCASSVPSLQQCASSVLLLLLPQAKDDLSGDTVFIASPAKRTVREPSCTQPSQLRRATTTLGLTDLYDLQDHKAPVFHGQRRRSTLEAIRSLPGDLMELGHTAYEALATEDGGETAGAGAGGAGAGGRSAHDQQR
jgi:hypothetical protein